MDCRMQWRTKKNGRWNEGWFHPADHCFIPSPILFRLFIPSCSPSSFPFSILQSPFFYYIELYLKACFLNSTKCVRVYFVSTKVAIGFDPPIRNSRFCVKIEAVFFFFWKRKHPLEEISLVYTFFLCVCSFACPHVRARARIIVKKETHKHIFVKTYVYIFF